MAHVCTFLIDFKKAKMRKKMNMRVAVDVFLKGNKNSLPHRTFNTTSFLKR